MTVHLRPNPHRRRTLQPGQVAELRVINRDGSGETAIYEAGEVIEAPNWTLDGKWLVFNGDGRLWKIAPDGSEGPIRIDTAPIEDLNNDHCLAPDSETVYVSANDGHIYAAALNGGKPRKITNDQDPSRRFRHYLHGVSPDGKTLAYVGLEFDRDDKVITRIYTIPAAGGPDTMIHDAGCPVDGPEYSPDGEWIWFNSEAAASKPGHAQVFRMRTDGSKVQQITFDDRVNWFPHFSPDGSHIFFISYPLGTLGHPPDKDVKLRMMDADGGNQRDLTAFFGGQGTINVNSWSPDSQRLAYVAYPMRK